MADDLVPRADYEVGYKKPPVSGQIKPGEVRNPTGRPKKADQLLALLDKELAKKSEKGLTNEEHIVMKLIELACKGEAWAAKQIFEMRVPKLAQAHTVTVQDMTRVAQTAIQAFERTLEQLPETQRTQLAERFAGYLMEYSEHDG